MIESDKIEAISAADVRSSDDDKVGSVGQVFLDPQTGRPEWAVVKTGIFGTKGAFVPLRNASWDGRAVRLAYDKDRVRNAPHVEPDDRGLDPDQQVQLYTYYGFTEATPTADTATTASSPPSAAPVSRGTDDAPVSLSDTARAAMSSGDASTVAAPTTTTSGDEPPTTAATPTSTAADGPTSSMALTKPPAAAMSDSDASARASDDDEDAAADQSIVATEGSETDADDGTMTRREEHLEVSVEPTATERVRLRKHVVTTQETVTVTIRREELRIERVPITADEASSMGSGTGIGESETEIVLYEERPVVTTVARPVERIRLTREVVAEEQTITGDVRKERIEVDGGAIG